MTRKDIPKGDRALELREQGLTTTQIAERLGVSLHAAHNMIGQAKRRRDKAAEVVSE
jgi:orotate phosphoribosyltransferase-like protein